MDVLDFIAGLIVYGVTAPHAITHDSNASAGSGFWSQYILLDGSFFGHVSFREGGIIPPTGVYLTLSPSLQRNIADVGVNGASGSDTVRRWTGVVEYLDELSMAVLRYCR